MEFSARFIREMTRPFYDARPFYNAQPFRFNSSDTSNPITLDSNNMFSKSLVVDTTGDNIEIPSIARIYYENIIRDNLIHSNARVERIILPLYTNGNSQSRRTFDGIMREFFCRPLLNQRVLKVTTNKGDTYYGGYGLILDEGFNPLLMCGLKARKVILEHGDDAEAVHIQYYRTICHVSPVVFTEPNKLINKGIIKKLIPLYTTMDIHFPNVSVGTSNSPDSRKVEVIIDDFSKFFISPIVPTPSKCSNDALNKCLNDNIEDILYLI